MERFVDTMKANSTLQVQQTAKDWFISFKDPFILWEEHAFAVVLEIVTAAIVFCIMRHENNRGSSTVYLLPTAMMAILSFEYLPLLPREGYQLWWYHEGIVNFWKGRLPSYVFMTFAIIHYVAYSLLKKSNLPVISKSFATAVVAMMMYFPFVWLAPRFLISFLHFDDPVFSSKFMGVPCIQLVVNFLYFFHITHLFEENFAAIPSQDRNAFNYCWYAAQSGIVSGIYTLVEQYLLYILVSLILRLHTGVCLLLALAVLWVLSNNEMSTYQLTSCSFGERLQPIRRRELWAVAGVFMVAVMLPLWLKTENMKSTGSRMELGPCQIYHEVSNTSPLNVKRRQFVCPEDTMNMPFDFHCVQDNYLAEGVRSKIDSYSICGKHMDSSEIARNILLYSVVCFSCIYTFMRLNFSFKLNEQDLKLLKKAE